ncbi:MAG: hypothetical protein Q4D26_09510 [Clostridia bacterium]|nr:hypothetical protein [Clostridia bacterium]
MKAEFALDEIRRLIKRNEKDNRIRTLVFIIAGIAVVVGVIVLILSKIKSQPGYEYDDWSELDDMDYDDYDDFDDYDDYDYEDEDFDDVDLEDSEDSLEI